MDTLLTGLCETGQATKEGAPRPSVVSERQEEEMMFFLNASIKGPRKGAERVPPDQKQPVVGCIAMIPSGTMIITPSQMVGGYERSSQG